MTRSLRQAALALLTVSTLVTSAVPVRAQNAPASQGSPAATQQPQGPGQPPPVQYAPPKEQQEQAAPPSSIPTRDLRISAGLNYSRSNSWFPDVIGPYTPMRVQLPMLTNTPKIDQLIQEGKLTLSLEDAIGLAIENNLDIAVQRYTPWLDEASLLLAKSGTNGRLVFDPTVTGQVLLEQLTNPINNPLLAGVGSSSSTTGVALQAPGIVDHNFVANFNYTEGFHYGTQLQVSFNNTRSSVNLGANLFNPYVESSLTAQITQPLLNGFGHTVNDRFIIEAERTVKVGEWQFAQAVIQDITTTQNDYWELVYSIENIKVEQTTVAADQELYDNNKKQLEIGTMAPLDVITAESQLATDQQALVQAQTVRLQDETKLLNDITKDPLAGPLAGIQIVPTTEIFTPDVVENMAIQDAVSEAWQKRPEMSQAELNLQNAGTEVKATRNLLLPALNLFGEYQATGIGGDQHTTVPTGEYSTGAGLESSLVFPAAGSGLSPAGAVGFVGSQTSTAGPTFLRGLGTDYDTLIHAQYPTIEGGITFTLPIRNRSAEAANATAQLNQRLQTTQLRQLQNTIFVAVRNAQIALIQDRAAVAAAEEARKFAQESYDDEVKKLQLGTSTAFTVTQKQQILTAAEGTELRDRANLIEALVNFNQAMGRTLDENHIIIDKPGVTSRVPNIPGTPSSQLNTK